MSNFLAIKNNKIYFDNTISSRNFIGYHTIKGNWKPYGYLIPLSFRGENIHDWLLGGQLTQQTELQLAAVITPARRVYIYSFSGRLGIMNVMSFQIEDDMFIVKSIETCIEEALGALCSMSGDLTKDDILSIYETYPQTAGDIQEWDLDYICEELKRRNPNGMATLRIPVNKETGSKPLKV